jgi:hypothetical protein
VVKCEQTQKSQIRKEMNTQIKKHGHHPFGEGKRRARWIGVSSIELDLELIQTQMAQKPQMREEAHVRIGAECANKI